MADVPTNLHGKRPFRLEVEGKHFDVPTYATLDKALTAASRLRESGSRRSWQIVARHGRGGYDRTVVAEGKPDGQ